MILLIQVYKIFTDMITLLTLMKNLSVSRLFSFFFFFFLVLSLLVLATYIPFCCIAETKRSHNNKAIHLFYVTLVILSFSPNQFNNLYLQVLYELLKINL